MTNTLHRFGKPETLRDDYIVFAMTSKGINDEGAIEKVQTFFRAALKHDPINMGNAVINPLYRPEKDLSFLKIYLVGRREKIAPETFIAEIAALGTAAVVFDNRKAMADFLKELQELDLGLSVNVSALIDDVRDVCGEIHLTPHSVEYSLPFEGDTARLPEREILSLTTMCGHGMIAANFARKMVDSVREGRLEQDQACRYMAKFCVCGVFNTTRALRILETTVKGA